MSDSSGNRYLTKSRFKLALDCPRKLFYTGKDRSPGSDGIRYANQNNSNEFLKALAAGGFQVGELAKFYFPGGLDLSAERNRETAFRLTMQELEKENCIIYEAAFVFENLYIRSDIFVKNGNSYSFYEVKAKGWNEDKDGDLVKIGKGGTFKINGSYADYIHDAVFQKYVIQKTLNKEVRGHLYLMDKGKRTDVEGLNQKFRLIRNGNDGFYVEIEPGFTSDQLRECIMIAKSIDEAYGVVMDSQYKLKGHQGTFEELIQKYAAQYAADDPGLFYEIKSECGKCEFRAKAIDRENGLECGFTQCHLASAHFKDQPAKLNMPLTYELWGGGWTAQKGRIISRGHFILTEIPEEEFKKRDEDSQGMHYNERKLVQIEMARSGTGTPHLLSNELKAEMATWKFPYHFIDFETSRVAIPFYKGGHPYYQVAFQFSHHTMDEYGNVEHAGEWINFKKGEYPNFEFIRTLKKELEGDEGTIFRYSHHENTVLKDILWQLKQSAESDKEELIAFIELITYDKDSNRKGSRNMVDLIEVLKRYYIHPDMKGSNSLKVVLPAVLNSSSYLQDKYGKRADNQPVYGNQIPSKNFSEGKVWAVQDENGRYKDPYTLLEQFNVGGLTSDELNEQFGTGDDGFGEETIKDGGAAMMAYQELQFSHVPDERRESIRKALLRYCELDTLAMVMLVEGWREMCG
jgi:hypothetical protein